MEDQNLPSSEKEPMQQSLTISGESLNYLRETAKWTTLLSIVGFIVIGLIVFMGLSAGSIISSIPMEQTQFLPSGMAFIFGGVYILMGLLYFFPTWFLFKFSQKMKRALSTESKEELSSALSNQKSFYKFWGIFMIIVIGFYALIGIIALLTMVLS